ncbi:MAG: Peroxiredoxin [Cyanobacteria bacterium RYN_339]|nr:Peroxiredoxin [Cyanobacteria bacterium RYN_339]
MFGSAPKPFPGDAAPVFSLPAHDGGHVTLVAFRGKQRVVLTFYPEDDTAGCTRALSALQDQKAAFDAFQTQLMGASHNEPESQRRFAAKLGLQFPLLSDPKGEVARVYGAKDLLPYFHRKTFLIDGRGVMRLMQEGQPRVDELLTFLDGLRGDLKEAT